MYPLLPIEKPTAPQRAVPAKAVFCVQILDDVGTVVVVVDVLVVVFVIVVLVVVLVEEDDDDVEEVVVVLLVVVVVFVVLVVVFTLHKVMVTSFVVVSGPIHRVDDPVLCF